MGTQRSRLDTPSYNLSKHPRGWLRPSTLRCYKATLLTDYRLSIATTLAEKLFALTILGDDRAVKETYAAAFRCTGRKRNVTASWERAMPAKLAKTRFSRA
ncbi:guanine deaminase [Pseudomonas saudiphocaensis]|uniref:Guanine deaminase n=1 Tax=Pseudomonas saudiphocaensis TaxID=1499686 RepID=A0A078LWM8_9PSED|nr:guanine deaminase [Pseudomonas saudiphocaensis]